MIINAENSLLGRIATIAAKKLLLGEEVIVVNCEKAVVSGKRKQIIDHYKKKFQRGSVRKGPFMCRKPEFIVKRTIRGMVPFKQPRGKAAYAKLKCYRGIPEGIKGAIKTIENAQASKLITASTITINDISKEVGGVK
jgi:large subunit ribosomal protein L13